MISGVNWYWRLTLGVNLVESKLGAPAIWLVLAVAGIVWTGIAAG